MVKPRVKSKKDGISTFIATLLLMVLAVSAGVVIYAYTMGYLGGFGGPQTMGAISLDTYNFASNTQLQVYVRNIGKTTFELQSVYIDGVAVPTGDFDHITIDENGVRDTRITYAAGFGTTTHVIKLIGVDNTQISFNAKRSASSGVVTYSLTINTVGSGSVAKSPNQSSYSLGASVQLTAIPLAGWVFSSWSGDLTGSTNPGTVVIDTDPSVTTTFVLGMASPTLSTTPPSGAVVGVVFTDSATLTGATSNAGGTVTYNLYSGAYPGGTPVGTPSTVAVTNGAVPNSDPFTVASAGSYYFTASYSGDVNNNPVPVGTYHEDFTVNAPATVTITITSSTAGSGFVEVDDVAYSTPYDFVWSPGGTHKLEALSPVSGGIDIQYVYSGWSDGGAQVHDYIVPSSSTTVTANYDTQYQLTMATNFGTTSPVVGTSWQNAGASVPISATAPTPGAGEQYVWVGWTGTGTGSYSGPTASPSITMNGPITETAVWTHQYQVSFSAGTGGSITTPATSPQWYDAGQSGISIVAAPNGGYTFSTWGSPAGIVIAAPTSASTTMTVNGAGTVTATFTATTQTLTLRPMGDGNYRDFSYLGDTRNWRCVDEQTADGDTTYVYIRDTGTSNRDTYATENSPVTTGTINSVTIYIVAEYSSSSGTGYADTILRISGNNYYGNNGNDFTLTTTYTSYSQIYTSNPAGGAWTWTTINNLECGVRLRTSSWNQGYARCTQVYIEVNYTP
jgi:hypothetical protein